MEHELFMLLLNALGEKGLIAFAALGLLYVVVRVIVAVTPSHADDEALERGTSAFMKILAGLRALVLGGAKKPPAPPAAGPVAVLVFAMLLSGCASPGDQFKASAVAYSAAVDTAAELRAHGKLEEKEVAVIDLAVTEGQLALNAWADALQAGEDYPDGYEVVSSVVRRIAVYVRGKKE